jgi:hypothetical protein
VIHHPELVAAATAAELGRVSAVIDTRTGQTSGDQIAAVVSGQPTAN